MRLNEQILGQDRPMDIFQQAFVSGRAGQSYLLVGPEGVGKQMAAWAFAQMLLCEQEPPLAPCGSCGHCLRIEKKQHEAVFFVEPDGLNIKIESAREILDFLSLRAMTKARVIIINQVQQLNVQAGNALLKILEEPPENTYFFLIAPSASSVLMTIRSRSQTLKFGPVPVPLMQQKLLLSNQQLWAVRASQGNFSVLDSLLEPSEQELRQQALDLLQLFLKDPDFLVNETWRDQLRDRGKALKIAQYWLVFLRDLLLLKKEQSLMAKQLSGGGTHELLINVDKLPLLKDLLGDSWHSLEALSSACFQMVAGMQSNQDSVLLTEKTFVEFQRTRHVD